MNIVYIAKNSAEGRRAEFLFNHRLYMIWNELQKFAGWNSRPIILRFPLVDLTKDYTEDEIYDLFAISTEEKVAINAYFDSKKIESDVE
jgi:hypothetical protein